MHPSIIGNQIGLAGDVDNTALATLTLIIVLAAVVVLFRRRIRLLLEKATKVIDALVGRSGSAETPDEDIKLRDMPESEGNERGDIPVRVFFVICALACVSMFFIELNPQAAVGAQATYRQTLSLLAVAPEHSVAKYDRTKHFGNWRDEDRDCLDTRAEVLTRDSLIPFSLKGCRVDSGRWLSVFDGRTHLLASQLQIDHLVPLREAWDSGASLWSKDRRVSYANDLDFAGSLSAMTSALNGNCKKLCKSDKDPTQWIPQTNRCLYAQRWVAVKYRWDLSIDSAEKRVLSKLLSGKCGEARLSVTKP